MRKDKFRIISIFLRPWLRILSLAFTVPINAQDQVPADPIPIFKKKFTSPFSTQNKESTKMVCRNGVNFNHSRKLTTTFAPSDSDF